MKRIAPLVALLAGCVAGPRPVVLPDGTQGLVLDCSGTARSYAHCMDAAAKACGGKYEIITQGASSPGAMNIGNGMIANAIRREMVVKCGG